MKIDLTAEIALSLKDYIDREISGAKLSKSIHQNFESADGLNKKQEITFKYYIDFFKKEGKELYLDSNIYLKEEVNELSEFLASFAAVE